jgi:hypothetical protein
MTSPSEAHAHVELSAEFEWTDITLANAAHHPVAHGLGTLVADVERGIYRIGYQAGSVLETELVALGAGERYAPDPAPPQMPAAAPVARTATFDDRHADAAHRHSVALTASRGGHECGLIVMVRATAGQEAPTLREAPPGVTAAGLRVEWEHDSDAGFAVWSTTQLAGSIGLRAPRDELCTGLEPVLEQAVWLARGWQTLVFVPCGLRGPAWADASVHLVPMSVAWDGRSADAVAVEALLARLVNAAGPPPADRVAQLAAALPGNPMAGILLAHLMLGDEAARGDPATSELIGALATLLPDHPDVRALRWLDPARGDVRPPAIDWPPMLDLAYEAVEDLDTREPGVLRDGSAAVRMSAQRFKEGLWTASHPDSAGLAQSAAAAFPQVTAAFQDPATQRVALHLERVRRSTRDESATTAALLSEPVADVAYYTGLPTAAVARALTDIEAAVPPPPSEPAAPAPGPAPAPGDEPSRPERVLSIVLRAFSIAFLLGAVVLAQPLDWEGVGALAAVAILMRSVLLAGLCALAGSDVRRFGAVCQFVAIALLVEMLLAGVVWVVAAPRAPVASLGMSVRADTALGVWIVLDAVTGLVIWSLWRHAFRARWHLRALTPGNHRTVAAISELLRDEPRALRPAEVASNVDEYLAAAARPHRVLARTSLLAVALLPLGRGRAPLALVPPADRRRILRRALRHRTAWAARPAIRTAHQLAALGYYADPRAAEELGAPAGLAVPPPTGTRPTIRTLDREQVVSPLGVDAVVVGSGPPGALMAYRLAERGLRTLIVERGAEVDPTARSGGTLQTVPEVLADGGLELLRSAQTTVLELSCLGGRSVAQNALWASAMPAVAERWNAPEVDAGLDAAQFEAAWDRVREWLPAADRAGDRLSGGASLLLAGMAALGVAPDGTTPTSPLPGPQRAAELSGRSQSVLDTLVPWGQRRFGDRLQTLTHCEAEKVVIHRGRVTGVECSLPGRDLLVQAPIVVLAAGALGSGHILRRSSVGGALGRRFSFDLSTTLIADFAQPIEPPGGAQLMAAIDPDEPSFVVETIALPLWLQAMTMPGLFEQHDANMRRLRHLVGVRVHLGVDRSKRIRRPYSDRPRTVELDADELKRFMLRVKTAGELLFAAGAIRVLPATVDYLELTTPEALTALTDLRRSDEISVSARPQGGAAMSRDPDRGVVDPSLHVHGAAGLYVCDASVFPTSIARAPMLTAMALAEYAADGIAGSGAPDDPPRAKRRPRARKRARPLTTRR